MNKFLALAFILLAGPASAQSFSSPESVEYDAAGNRWFAGQNGSGVILVHSPGSNSLLPFATGCASGPHGLEIMGTTLYACDGGSIRGFDLATGTQTFNLSLGATFLNGLTSDGSTYLFATDFTAKKIYRICPSAGTFNVMCTTVKTPNGIYYDGPNNRLVYVTWGSNAPVQAMSLADSTYATVLSTTMGNCDGITRDAAGYWYVTAWTGNQLWRIDPAFAGPPVSVMTGLSSPADIDINSANDSIGIPNSGSANNVVYYTGITTGLPAHDILMGNIYPTPSIQGVNIELPEPLTYGHIEVYDMRGNLVLDDVFTGASYLLLRNDLADGAYTVIITDAQSAPVLRREIVFTGKD